MTSASAMLKADRYFPDHGDSSYDVTHYDLELSYRIDSNRLDGRAALHAVARADLDELRLDLSGLDVRKVTIDAKPVAKYSAKRGRLVVRSAKVIEAGTEFRLDIRYDGRPRPLGDGSDGMGWEELDDGVIVAGQTNGAPSWFPCNDRPSSKATYRIAVTTASAYHVLANGTLTAHRRSAGATTWVYEERNPMATYLATVQIGRYVTLEVPSSPVPMTAVLPEKCLPRYDATFGRQPEMMAYFIDTFGAYPFDRYTAVVTEDDLEIPLEAQGLATFGANFLTGDWDSTRLVAHELAHQWFGNSLTLADWSDIWLHEGFACYAEWLWSEKSGGRSALDWAEEHWRKLADKPQDLVLGDPGPDGMFDDRVYKRGALLLHALRHQVGETTFSALLREWTTRNSYGSVTTRMFVQLAEELTGSSLDKLFTDWLWTAELPELPR